MRGGEKEKEERERQRESERGRERERDRERERTGGVAPVGFRKLEAAVRRRGGEQAGNKPAREQEQPLEVRETWSCRE